MSTHFFLLVVKPVWETNSLYLIRALYNYGLQITFKFIFSFNPPAILQCQAETNMWSWPEGRASHGRFLIPEAGRGQPFPHHDKIVCLSLLKSLQGLLPSAPSRLHCHPLQEAPGCALLLCPPHGLQHG